MSVVIGIDIGGTFIDVVATGDGGIRIAKFPSTPHAPAEGLFAGLGQLIALGRIKPCDVRRVVHGSTVATNALLEGTWARTALITTAGFRDVLEIGRQARRDLYNLSVERQPPIVSRDLRFEVSERVASNGDVLIPLDVEEIRALGPVLRESGVESIAVVLLFSFLVPEHEREVKRVLAEELDVPITLSSDVLAEFREYERASTTVVCAALRPVIEGYLGQVEQKAKAIALPHDWQIMQSNGAVTGAGNAASEPARIVLSGPAAGVEGARLIGQLAGEPDLITLDMGGTSCDVALIRGGDISCVSSGEVAGCPIALQMADIHTIGAGGGSVAWIDTGGAMRVGPQSAGADPGPACYGRGGRAATVTDAHVALGHLLANRPIGGLPELGCTEARKAISRLAERLALSIEQAALGILEVADAAMERAIRVMTIERGHDPRGFALLAFGGAGPLHAASIARRMSIPRVLVPAAAGVLSALGLLAAEAGRDGSRSIVRPLGDVDLAAVGGIIDELIQRGREALLEEGVPEKAIAAAVSADLRYVGQSHELAVPVPEARGGRVDASTVEALEAGFHQAHRSRFGHARPEHAVEWVTVRVRVSGPAEILDLRQGWTGTLEAVETVPVWFDSHGPLETAVFERERVPADALFRGPALFVGNDATLLVPPGVSGRCDAQGAVALEVR
ncbi:hydantoinase/oxoprolinase family protein [Candidatus Bipolaricaulota bacterium]